MDVKELVELAEAEGAYQPILIKGQKVMDGWRESMHRWEFIEPHIKSNMTVIDIGSHYGYFTTKIARQFKSFVWSIEADPKRAEIQRRVLAANELTNVVLSEHKWTLETTEKLLSTCFTADVILLLSVGHYFDRETMPQMFANLAKLAPTLIIEWPSKEELEVASRDFIQNTDIDKLLGDNYAHVEVIGKGRSPKHKDVDRALYRASNDTIYMASNEGISRPPAKSYIGSPVNKTHDVQYANRDWYIDGRKRMFPGMTLDDLRHFGMTYPSLNAIIARAANAYEQLIQKRKGKVTDINIRNVLMTENGVRLIDFTEGLDSDTIYDMPMADYIERTLSRDPAFHAKEFIEMWEGTWQP